MGADILYPEWQLLASCQMCVFLAVLFADLNSITLVQRTWWVTASPALSPSGLCLNITGCCLPPPSPPPLTVFVKPDPLVNQNPWACSVTRLDWENEGLDSEVAGCCSRVNCLCWTISPGNTVQTICGSSFLTGDGMWLVGFWPSDHRASRSDLYCQLVCNPCVFKSVEMQTREKFSHVALTLWDKSIQWKQESLSSRFPWWFLNSCQILRNCGDPDEELVFQSTSPLITWARSKYVH